MTSWKVGRLGKSGLSVFMSSEMVMISRPWDQVPNAEQRQTLWAVREAEK